MGTKEYLTRMFTYNRGNKLHMSGTGGERKPARCPQLATKIEWREERECQTGQ